MSKNRHGLARSIPDRIKREVRKRSKFGCVLCRCAFYEYEHIDPPFEHATSHDPSKICCLCSSCHSAVTRGQRSKQSVAAAYATIQSASAENVPPPVGPLDFYGGGAELRIGGLHYSPLVQTVLRVYGKDIIKVIPGKNGMPGSISATLTDENGIPALRLVKNAWEGSTEHWDIEVTGQRITVRTRARMITLQLRLEPPGVIVLERLDMRINDCHLLASESAYAAGRYLEDGSIAWVYSQVSILRTSPNAVAIEFTSPDELQSRVRRCGNFGSSLVTADGNHICSSTLGCMWIPLGISIASYCGGFREYGTAVGTRPIDGVRRMICRGSRAVMRYIGTGIESY